MTTLFPASRAAEEFARVVDGTASPQVAERYAGLAGTITLLREHPAPAPRPAFVADLRERLLIAADELLVAVEPSSAPASTVTPLRPRRARSGERHLGAAAAALLLVGGAAGVAAASQGALPGDALYPVKRGIEGAELRMAGGDAAKGRDLLHQASTRLDELHTILSGPGASVDQIDQTLGDFTSSAGRGSDLVFTSYRADNNGADIVAVRTFATQQMDELAALKKLAPPTSAPAFDEAAALLAQIDQEARVLCVACSAAAPLTMPSSLVAPTSGAALDTLVGAPVARAEAAVRLAALARQQLTTDAAAAEAAARQLAQSGTGTSTGTGTATGTSSTSTSGLPQSVTLSRQPIPDLVQGLTSTLDTTTGGTGGTGSTGGTLGDTTQKVTDGVGSTLDGVGGAVGDTTQQLGDATSGVTGGLTGN